MVARCIYTQKKNFMGSTAIVANSIPLGVGLGLSIKLEKKSKISFIFLVMQQSRKEYFMNLQTLQLFTNYL